MPGKYSRKIVPLEVRGVSGGNILKDFPLPEPAHEHSMGLDDPLKALSSYLAAYDDAASDVTSPTIVDGRHSNLSNSYTTGNTTERSSIYSFGEDEFDREASRRVRYLFEEIDSMLFEDYQGPQHLYNECDEWVGRFPHLRILGQQKIAPQDKGYQLLPQGVRPCTATNMLTDVTDQDITGATHAMHELSITGFHIDVKSPPAEAHVINADGTVEYSPYEKEEIFAQDGFVEDIIAVDYKSTDEDSGKSGGCHHRPGGGGGRGMPPITPHSLVLESIAVNSFDIVWSEVISWMRHLVRRYTQQLPPLGDQNAKQPLGLALQGDLVPASMTSSPRDVYHQSREMSILSTGRFQGEKRLVGPNISTLESLLNISQKPVLKRDKSTLQDTDSQLSTSFLPLSSFGVRPGSGLTRFNYGRPGSSVRGDPFGGGGGAGGGGRSSASARKKGGRLLPIDRTKTPGGDDDRFVMHNEVLRGHRLPAVPDRLSPPPSSAQGPGPPPLTFPRNGALPPISYDQNDNNSSNKHAVKPSYWKSYYLKRRQENRKPVSMRASSAIHDKEPRLQYRERSFTTGTNLNLNAANFDRPSTTHAIYRPDASYSNMGRQRSTTPLGFSGSALHSMNNVRSGLGTVNALSGGHTAGQSSSDVLSLDVRGSSINQPMDAAELEETEHIQDMIHSQWDYRGRLIHSSVFKNLEGGNVLPSQLRRAKQPYNVGSVR